MAFKLADLFVSITGDDRPLHRTLAGVRGTLGAMGGAGVGAIGSGLSSIAGLAGVAGAALAGVGVVAGGAMAAGIYKSIMAASDLNETLNKASEVFGTQVSKITAEADKMAKDFGYPKKTFLDAAASIGLIGKASGQTSSEAADLSVRMAKLAADASSFYNVSLDEALTSLRSGLVGEAEPLRRFGVLLNEAAVSAEAVRLKLAKVGATLTEGQKVQARSSLIFAGMATAQGDLSRTASGTANRMREAWGRIENVMAAVGASMQPVFDTILGKGIGALGALEEAVPSVNAKITELGESIGLFLGTPAVQQIQDGIGGAFTWLRDTAEEVFDTITFTLRNWGAIVEAVGVQVGGKLVNIGEGFNWLMETAGAFLGWFGNNFSRIFIDAFNAVATSMANLGDNFLNFGTSVMEWMQSGFTEWNFDWKPLTEGFKATVDELPKIAGPAFSSVQDELDAIFEGIGESEVARAAEKAKQAAAVVAAKDRPGQAQGQAKAKKEVRNFELADFSKKLQEEILGKDKDTKRTADGIGRLVTLQQRNNDIQQQILKKPPGPGFAV